MATALFPGHSKCCHPCWVPREPSPAPVVMPMSPCVPHNQRPTLRHATELWALQFKHKTKQKKRFYWLQEWCWGLGPVLVLPYGMLGQPDWVLTRDSAHSQHVLSRAGCSGTVPSVNCHQLLLTHSSGRTASFSFLAPIWHLEVGILCRGHRLVSCLSCARPYANAEKSVDPTFKVLPVCWGQQMADRQQQHHNTLL